MKHTSKLAAAFAVATLAASGAAVSAEAKTGTINGYDVTYTENSRSVFRDAALLQGAITMVNRHNGQKSLSNGYILVNVDKNTKAETLTGVIAINPKTAARRSAP